jgi:hypothetical protein
MGSVLPHLFFCPFEQAVGAHGLTVVVESDSVFLAPAPLARLVAGPVAGFTLADRVHVRVIASVA